MASPTSEERPAKRTCRVELDPDEPPASKETPASEETPTCEEPEPVGRVIFSSNREDEVTGDNSQTVFAFLKNSNCTNGGQ